MQLKLCGISVHIHPWNTAFFTYKIHVQYLVIYFSSLQIGAFTLYLDEKSLGTYLLCGIYSVKAYHISRVMNWLQRNPEKKCVVIICLHSNK